MIADALRNEIEQYAARMPTENPLYERAAEGKLRASHLASYLANVHYLIRHTPVHLSRAESRARALGDQALARHFVQKCAEEAGHDVWAQRDWARVSGEIRLPADADVLPTMTSLVDFIAEIIDEDPAQYLAYILFAEYLIVLLGPAWLTLLEERCGIPRSSMTVIGNHAELDREHVEEALDQIDALVGDPKKLSPMRRVLHDAIAHFDAFCAEVTHQERTDGQPAHRATPHVSAA